MTTCIRGSQAALGLMRSSRNPRVCSSCLATTRQSKPSLRRPYSAAAPALKSHTPPSPPIKLDTTPPHPPAGSAPLPEYIIKSGILLSRPPLLTKPPSSFENAFFFYQKRLNERLVMPFTRYFYFKKDTPADTDWKIKAKERNLQPARELGGYNPYGEAGWNDELLVGDGLSGRGALVESILREAEVRVVEGKDGKAVEVKVEEGGERGLEGRPLSRVTEADRVRDTKRLDRKLARTLYLVVKRKDGGWGFPAGELVERENLHQAAERILTQTAGPNMNTWLVGHAPIGHYTTIPRLHDSTDPENTNPNPSKKSTKVVKSGEKTFFMKGRIMAGQADLKGNLYGMEDYAWLTKAEVEGKVGRKYWSWVKNMLADR